MEAQVKDKLKEEEFNDCITQLGFDPEEIISALIYLKKGNQPIVRIEKKVSVPAIKKSITFMEEYVSVRKVV